MAHYAPRLIVAAICSVVVCGSQNASISLIMPGAFHGDEITARTGERWTGLAPSRGGFEWRPFTILTRRVEDAVVDAPGQRTGIEVTVKGGSPVFLVKGIDLLGDKVRTAIYSPGGLVLPEKDALEIYCGDACGAYKIRVAGRRLRDDDPAGVSRLVLESSEGVQQTLYEWPNGLLDQHCELIWAGDLDGDGKVDLFMNLSDHYNVMEWTLFLSSKSPKGKLVERAAVFHTVGC